MIKITKIEEKIHEFDDPYWFSPLFWNFKNSYHFDTITDQNQVSEFRNGRLLRLPHLIPQHIPFRNGRLSASLRLGPRHIPLRNGRLLRQPCRLRPRENERVGTSSVPPSPHTSIAHAQRLFSLSLGDYAKTRVFLKSFDLKIGSLIVYIHVCIVFSFANLLWCFCFCVFLVHCNIALKTARRKTLRQKDEAVEEKFAIECKVHTVQGIPQIYVGGRRKWRWRWLQFDDFRGLNY